MRIPHGWLAELVPGLPDADALSELLPGLGLGVEAVHERPAAPAGVVVAEVREVLKIEGSDHLLRVRAFDGRDTHQVVCGAPNCRPGVRSALVPPGTELPAAGLRVERRTLAGVESAGMLASPRELGLFDHAAGILTLPPDTPLGLDLQEVWPAETVLELELTPNRADAFSLLGVARDLCAKLGVSLRHPAAGATPADGDDDAFEVQVADPEGCPHLVTRRITGVRVGPSPVWLQRRLAALGLRPRNNVVDVTNYVTFELGQPTHAYDRRALPKGVLQVRRAEAGEEVQLLDERTYALDPRDLVIATPNEHGASSPVGLAGVMGGLHDSVRADSDEVVLEAAHFDPVSIRKTAKRHGLHSDAHYRFERGVDPALPPVAAARAAALIAETSGGTVVPARSRTGGAPAPAEIDFRPSRVSFLMAFDVEAPLQRRYLEALGCEVHEDEADAWRVRPPSWRFDLSIEEDLVEEVGRLHGYEHVGATRPDLSFTPPHTDPTHRALRDALAAAGLQETIAYVFSGDEELARAHAPEARVRLSNPQGVERARLRTALHPGLLAAAAANRGADGLALFEIGRVFLEPEEERLAVLLSGAWERGVWREGTRVDVWRLRGVLEGLATRWRAALEVRPARPEEAPMLHPGVAGVVSWEGREVGIMGRLHPEVAAAYELADVYLAELTLPLAPGPLAIEDVPRQPYAERDLAIVAPAEVPYARLAALVREPAGPRLVHAEPFDVYQGPPLGSHERSVAIRLRWRHPERALRDEEVDAWLAAVADAVRAAGFGIRGS
ncbi:MAG: phenylalanine--tRNA ligase subunit beta [Trueperaceae bacterium]|nr:phenylalanine--tRNA ligase subunit beta [Trueperaceae bacterium]